MAFALCAFPVVVGAGDGVLQRGERGEEQGAFEDLAASPGGVVAADGRAGSPGHRRESGVGPDLAHGPGSFGRVSR